MDLIETFDQRLRAAANGSAPEAELLPERLAQATAETLRADGAGISMVFAVRRRLPLGASSGDAADAERLQFTLGDGPCLHVHDTGDPVAVGEDELRERWPAFHEELTSRTPFRSVVSAPLLGELHGVGAIDLFFRQPQVPEQLPYADTVRVTYAVGEHLRQGHQRGVDDGPAWLDAPQARRRSRVWQAIGFVNSGLEVTSTDALALLRAHAFSSGLLLDDLAERVLDRRVPLAELADPDGSP